MIVSIIVKCVCQKNLPSLDFRMVFMAFDLIFLVWPSTLELLSEFISLPSSEETRFLVKRPKTDQRPSDPAISALIYQFFKPSLFIVTKKVTEYGVRFHGVWRDASKAKQGRMVQGSKGCRELYKTSGLSGLSSLFLAF